MPDGGDLRSELNCFFRCSNHSFVDGGRLLETAAASMTGLLIVFLIHLVAGRLIPAPIFELPTHSDYQPDPQPESHGRQ